MKTYQLGLMGIGLLLLSACAGGTGGAEGGGGTSTTASGGAAGNGGKGGSAGAAGAAGTGGTATGGAAGAGGTGGSAGSGGAAGAAGAGGSGGTGGYAEHLLVLAGSPAGLLGAEYKDGGAWQSHPIAGATDHVPALATATNNGHNRSFGLFRSSADGTLHLTDWTPGNWKAPASLGPDFTSKGEPTAIGGNAFWLFFQAPDLTYYRAFSKLPGDWMDPDQIVWFDNGVATKTKGASAGTYETYEGTDGFAFVGQDATMYLQTFDFGNWTMPRAHGDPGTAAKRPIKAEGLLDTLILWPRTDGQVSFLNYLPFDMTGPAQLIPGVTTNDIVAATSIGGGYVMAYRGTDGNLYVARMTYQGPDPVWFAPELIGGGISIEGSPALADAFIGSTSEAELIFITAGTGEVYHSRLINDVWTQPALIGGSGLKSVAVKRVFQTF